MATAKNVPSAVANDGFAITPSDTVNIVADAGNTKDYTNCYVHNSHTAAGLVKVNTASGVSLTVMINSGDTFPLAVSRVWSTGTDAALLSNLVGLVGT